jgi:hypothetical protein
MSNIAYLSDNVRDDLPPNYYEAVQIKYRTQQNIGKTSNVRNTSNENILPSVNNELTERNSLSSRSSSMSEIGQNLAQNSINETIISTSYDNEVIIRNNQSIHSNSAHSNQMTAYLNISESGDESINLASHSSDV